MLPQISGDRHDFRVVNHFARHTHWLHGTGVFFAQDAIVLFVPLLILAWWLGRRDNSPRRVATAVWALPAAAIALLLGKLVSDAADEPRPFVAMPKTLTLVHHAADAGFPSDHATAAGAFAVAIIVVSWRLGLLAVALALLIAFARVYVGVHYPQDVVSGLALGAIVALLGVWLVVPLLARLAERLTGTALRPLIVSRTAT